jgi:hypothetical protein
MDTSTRDSIRGLILDTAARTVQRIAKSNSSNPFFDAILSKDVIKYSSFERSFSTSWGQKAVEEMARMVAKSAGRIAERPRDTVLTNATDAQIEAVGYIVESLRNKTSPDWSAEVQRVLSAKGNALASPATVRSDLWVSDVGGAGAGSYISIKTVMPNIDQTAVAKSDMLRLLAHDEDCKVFFALPYNPYGTDRQDYEFRPPFSIFDMKNDDCVLIGEEFWDFVGGVGTFSEIVNICTEVGPEIRLRIANI